MAKMKPTVRYRKNKVELPVKGLLDNMLEAIKQETIENMASHVRNASMKSVNSLDYGVFPFYEKNLYTGFLWGDFSFKVMQRGRKQGNIPSNFAQIIEKWIIDKGITIHTNTKNGYNPNSWNKQVSRVSWAIAMEIKKHGTGLHHYNLFDDIMSSSIEKNFAKLKENLRFAFSQAMAWSYIQKK